MRKSKAYWYLFIPFRRFYLPATLERSFADVKFDNVYLIDESYPDSDFSNMELFVLLNHQQHSYKQLINSIQEKCRYYINHYLVNVDGKTMIHFNFPCEESWNSFLDSKYSKMYPNKTNLLKTKTFASNYLIKRTDQSYYRIEYHALLHSEDYFNDYILPDIENEHERLIETIKNREYDDKINIKELIWSN